MQGSLLIAETTSLKAVKYNTCGLLYRITNMLSWFAIYSDSVYLGSTVVEYYSVKHIITSAIYHL